MRSPTLERIAWSSSSRAKHMPNSGFLEGAWMMVTWDWSEGC